MEASNHEILHFGLHPFKAGAIKNVGFHDWRGILNCGVQGMPSPAPRNLKHRQSINGYKITVSSLSSNRVAN
jgi:hypothetical protein